MWVNYNKVVRVDPISIWLLSLEEETVTQRNTRDEHIENKDTTRNLYLQMKKRGLRRN